MRRQLPDAPGYLTPGVVAEPQQGESCLAIAARERKGRVMNADIIRAVKGDWQAMAIDYSGGKR